MSRCIVRRVIDERPGTWHGSTQYMGLGRGRWVADEKHARVFVNAGGAKNAIRADVGARHPSYQPLPHVHFHVQPVRVEAMGDAEEYKPCK